MRILKHLLKCICAGLVAFCILCALFSFYTFTPVHTNNVQENSDYIWPPNAYWSIMTEGIAHGRFDANGYNNIQVIEQPDILLLGSSHMEAVNVQQDENTAYLLNEHLAGSHTVYNLGVSGHHFTKVCKYLPKTLELYADNAEYIIIETSSTHITVESVDALLNGTVDFTSSHDSGLIAFLQKLPFARQIYHQFSHGLLDLLLPSNNKNASKDSSAPTTANEAAYDALFHYLADTMSQYNAQLIIFYHPTESLQEDGSVVFTFDEGTTMFAQKCEENGIIFLDMTQPFTDMYNESHLLPHGFITGEIGVGHLNAHGHSAIAQQLADIITRIEVAN